MTHRTFRVTYRKLDNEPYTSDFNVPAIHATNAAKAGVWIKTNLLAPRGLLLLGLEVV